MCYLAGSAECAGSQRVRERQGKICIFGRRKQETVVNQVVISSKEVEVYLNITSVGQMVEELKAKLRKLIAANKIHEAIEGMKELSKDNERLRDEVLLIESRLSDLEEKIGKSILDRLDEERINNQIRDSLVRLISRVNESDFVIFVENSEIVVKLREELKRLEIVISDYVEEVEKLRANLDDKTKNNMRLQNNLNENAEVIKGLKELLSEKTVLICPDCDGNGKNKEKFDISSFNSLGAAPIKSTEKTKGFFAWLYNEHGNENNTCKTCGGTGFLRFIK